MNIVLAVEEVMATHSGILAWKILWTEETGSLQSTGSQRVEHNLATEQQQQYIFNGESDLARLLQKK